MAAEAPAAPPPSPSVEIVEGGPPPPPPPPKGEIHVTPGSVEAGPPSNQPKKGSATERMFEELRKRAKPQFFESVPEETPIQPAQSPPAHDAKTTPDNEQAPPQAPGESKPPGAPEEKKKTNPWKLVDEYKARSAKAENRIAELERAMPELSKVQEIQAQLSALSNRNDALEKEIRYHNYAKSAEYQEKYEKPYHAYWARVAKEMAEITAMDKSGEARRGNVNDLAEIVNMPLGDAQALSEERFGNLANYVMGYRSKILELYEAQEQAKTKAREDSIQRDKETIAGQTRLNGEIATHIKTVWDKANADLLADDKVGTLFKPVEGDEDGNTRLTKGFELVDRAFSKNPNDPNLTPEQRADIVKLHAAVRARAAGFGRLNAAYIRIKDENEALKKELASYKGSVPGTGGGQKHVTSPAELKGMDRIRQELIKISKPI